MTEYIVHVLSALNARNISRSLNLPQKFFMWKLLACVSNEVKRLENNHHCLLCFKGPIRIFWIAAIGKIHSLWPSWRLWNDHGSNSGLELDRLDFTFAAVDGLSAAFPPPLKKHLELLSFSYFKSRQCFIYRPRKIWNPPVDGICC